MSFSCILPYSPLYFSIIILTGDYYWTIIKYFSIITRLLSIIIVSFLYLYEIITGLLLDIYGIIYEIISMRPLLLQYSPLFLDSSCIIPSYSSILPGYFLDYSYHFMAYLWKDNQISCKY